MGADHMPHVLMNTNLRQVEILAREALQNSFDERITENCLPLKFVCKKHILVGNQKKNFVDALRLKDIKDKKDYLPPAHNYFEKGDAALKDLSDYDKELPVLEVSDFNSNGLGGRWNRGQG